MEGSTSEPLNEVKYMGVYEDTLEDIEKAQGIIPGFINALPGALPVHDWHTLEQDDLEEIYLERARYLLSVDDMLEEMLS